MSGPVITTGPVCGGGCEGPASYNHDGTRIPGSLRVLADQIREWAATAAEDGLAYEEYVAYCS